VDLTKLQPVEKSPFGCPACHSYAIYRSRLHGFERIKKYFTIERPYRCHDCGWRGWLENIRYASFPLPGGNPGPRKPR
jgi:predicted RNA-binding Zn-ribbon protein involved in translation (DUF1610 family)